MHYKNINLKFKEYTKDPGICGRNRPFCRRKMERITVIEKLMIKINTDDSEDFCVCL